MESFFSFLERRVDDCSSLLCVGLDPHKADLEQNTAGSALKFSLNLVRKTAPFAAAFKPNAAFFEQFGADGWNALAEVIEAVHEQSRKLGSKIMVVLDAKRGDISTTAEAYAISAFKTLGADCVTLNPYLGRDSIEPFLGYPEKGVFLLCKTSNPGSVDLQDLTLSTGDLLYEHVARLAMDWNNNKNIGLVVGATQPEAMRRVRKLNPTAWLLAPGVGAQGGDLESALRAGLRSDGKGVLLPVSRAISRAADPARAAANLRDEVLEVLRSLGKQQIEGLP